MTDTATPEIYPWGRRFEGVGVTFRTMVAADRDKLLSLTRALPEHDLLFLPMDITQAEVIDAWIHDIESGKTLTVLAEEDDRLIGYCSLHYSEILWTRHLGEIRLFVGPEHRSKGIGGELARRVFEIASELGLQKLVVHMLASQRTAQTLFHDLGFIPEAMLHDWAIDRNGRTHDLITMSREVEDDERGS